MTVKKIMYFFRELFGKEVSDLVPVYRKRTIQPLPAQVAVPPQEEQKRAESKSRLAAVYTSKKVLYNANSGRHLTARVVGMNDYGEIVLRRAGHRNAPSFVRASTSVSLR